MWFAISVSAAALDVPEPGEVWIPGWTVQDVRWHPEYIRVVTENAVGDVASVEIVPSTGIESEWTSDCCRVQPLPTEEADLAFLALSVAKLRNLESSGQGLTWFDEPSESATVFEPPAIDQHLTYHQMVGLLAVSCCVLWTLMARRENSGVRASYRCIAGASFSLAVAVYLRHLGLSADYQSDEIALLFYGSTSYLFEDPMMGINPPFLRVVFSALFEPIQALHYGRLFSLSCSIVAVGFAWHIGHHFFRLRGAVLAALTVAILPEAVQTGALFRSYAPWLAVACWHVWCILQVAGDTSKSRVSGAGIQLAISGVLLVQLHFFSTVLLFFLGLGFLSTVRSRRLFFAYLPAMLSFLPFLPSIVEAQQLWIHPGQGHIFQPIEQVIGLGFGGPGTLVVLFVTLGHVICFRQLPDAQRVLLAATVGAAVGAMTFGRVQMLTTHVAVFGLPWVIGLVAGFPALSKRNGTDLAPGGRSLVWVVSMALLIPVGLSAQRQAVSTGVQQFVHEGTTTIFEKELKHVRVLPAHALASVYFYLVGTPFYANRQEVRCQPGATCFQTAGTMFSDASEAGGGGTVLHVLGGSEPLTVEELHGCDPLRTEPGFVLLDCD